MYRTISTNAISVGDRIVIGSGTVTVVSVRVVSGIIALTVRHPRSGVVPMSFRPNDRISLKVN